MRTPVRGYAALKTNSMGYTRYWKQPFGIEPAAFRAIVEDARRVFATVEIPLCGSAGVRPLSEDCSRTNGAACSTDDEIVFNGVHEASCEWFVFSPTASPFECVKTRGEPYDIVAAAVLAIAKEHAPKQVLNITSDVPGWEQWAPCVELCVASGVSISSATRRRLRRDVCLESRDWQPPQTAQQRSSMRAWDRDRALVAEHVRASFDPKYLRYQSTHPLPEESKVSNLPHFGLMLRRSVDARDVPLESAALRDQIEAMRLGWNRSHESIMAEVVLDETLRFRAGVADRWRRC